MDYTPEIVQVIPHEDYTVSVYFVDGKIVRYDVKPKLGKGVFKALEDIEVFMERCTIMNDTLAWDIDGTNDGFALFIGACRVIKSRMSVSRGRAA